MINDRFLYDGKAHLLLNQVQRCALYNFQIKIENGEYGFESYDCECGAKYQELITLAEKDRYGLKVITKICPKCGLLMTNPRMTQESYNKFYDSYYRQIYVGKRYAENRYFERQRKHGKVIYEYIDSNCDVKKIHSVLEIGCGAGGILSIFKDKGLEKCKGIDLGAEYIQFGREMGLDLEICHSKALVNVESEQYDLIILSHVLEHFLDIRGELEIIRKLLSEEGILYIEVPGIKNICEDYDGDFLKYLQNAHVRHFTYETLSQLMAWNGFKQLSGNEKVQSLFVKGAFEIGVKEFYDDIFDFIAKCETEYNRLNGSEIKETTDDKYYNIMMLLDCWMTLNRTSKRIVDYFHEREIREIAIYGMGILGRQLHSELEHSDIEISFIIDQREIENIGIPVFKPENEFPDVDMIVMTTVEGYTDIRKIIKREGVEIVPLAEIIYAVIL